METLHQRHKICFAEDATTQYEDDEGDDIRSLLQQIMIEQTNIGACLIALANKAERKAKPEVFTVTSCE